MIAGARPRMLQPGLGGGRRVGVEHGLHVAVGVRGDILLADAQLQTLATSARLGERALIADAGVHVPNVGGPPFGVAVVGDAIDLVQLEPIVGELVAGARLQVDDARIDAIAAHGRLAFVATPQHALAHAVVVLVHEQQSEPAAAITDYHARRQVPVIMVTTCRQSSSPSPRRSPARV